MAGEKFLDIAKNVVVSRTVFGQLYDRMMTRDDPGARNFIALSMLRAERAPGLSGRDKDQADFAEAFEAADATNLLYKFLAQHAAQLFENSQIADTSLQSLTNLKQTFQGGLTVTLGMTKALRRTGFITCRLPNGETEKGSGFLIGPHLVLTNWHVVHSLLDATGQPKDDSHLRMTIEFDFLTQADGRVEKTIPYGPVAPIKVPGGASQQRWLVASSEAHMEEMVGGQGRAWPGKPDELLQKLDFAVIELDGTPGHERSWYDLEEAVWPHEGDSLTLIQFPLGLAMVVMPGEFEAPAAFTDNDKPPRILHTANAARGSSGGLCLVDGSKAAALHQAGKTFKDGTIRNAAVPLPLIAAAAGAKVKERIATAPRIVRNGPNNVPILGRRNFQALVDEALRGDIRILTIQTSFDNDTRQPRTKIGKSFSTAILQALLPAPEHIVFSVAAARLTSDAYKAARLIVETVNNSSVDKLPKPAEGQAALSQSATTALVDSVIDAMRAAAGDGSLWLVIDDLDRNRIASESTAGVFLTALYKAMASEKKLRIVLIGLVQELPALTGLATGADTVVDHISDNDVEDWITAELGPRLPLLRPVAQLFVAIARSVAEPAINDKGRTGAIAEVLKAHLGPKLRAHP
jgi:Trypsin-like peptidase domain